MDIERISYNDELLAIIVYGSFQSDGIHFFSEEKHSQQVALLKHPSGKVIQAHIHNSVERTIYDTTEVLILRKGKLRVNFYNTGNEFLMSRLLQKDDLIILLKGGHGLEVIEDVEIIEVKQGPYLGDRDKTRFDPRR